MITQAEYEKIIAEKNYLLFRISLCIFTMSRVIKRQNRKLFQPHSSFVTRDRIHLMLWGFYF